MSVRPSLIWINKYSKICIYCAVSRGDGPNARHNLLTDEALKGVTVFLQVNRK